MADITVTAANVLFVSGTKNKIYDAGETITAGMVVYLKASDNEWYKAQKDGTAAESGSGVSLGIALNGASDGQPLAVCTAGVVNMGATLTVGETYIVSATAGGVAPIADVSTHYLTILGYAGTTANLTLDLNATGITHA